MTVKTSWNRIDANLIPANIITGKTIFGVIWAAPTGTPTPIAWGIVQTNILYRSWAQYSGAYIPTNWFVSFWVYIYGIYAYCFYWHGISFWGSYMNITCYKINMTTNTIVAIIWGWFSSWWYHFAWGTSTYINWTTLALNCTLVSPEKQYFNLLTDTFSGVTGWYDTSWSLVTATSFVNNWVTYTPGWYDNNQGAAFYWEQDLNIS
jgi:hypothetical protein